MPLPDGTNLFVPKVRVSVPKVEVPAASSVLENIREIVGPDNIRSILIGGGAGGAIFAACYAMYKLSGSEGGSTVTRGRRLKDRTRTDNMEVDQRVIINSGMRGFYTPSISTASLHLETFLRVVGVLYERNVSNGETQEEGDAPLMEYGNEVADDFRDCIQILEQDYDLKLDRNNISASRRTASHLVEVILENEFSWYEGVLIWRWIHDQGQAMSRIQKAIRLDDEVIAEVAGKVREVTKHHPIGQMDRESFIKSMKQGIHDISAALGRHKYFQGQSPGPVDCHAFAIFIQLMWNMPGSPFEQQIKKYPNLVDFVKRMKEIYWPDWNHLILRPDAFDDIYRGLVRNRSTSTGDRSRRNMKFKRSRAPGPSHRTQSISPEYHRQVSPSIQSGLKFKSYARRPRTHDASSMKSAMADESSETVNSNVLFRPKPVGILKSVNNAGTSVDRVRTGIVNAGDAQTTFLQLPTEHSVGRRKKSTTRFKDD